MRLPDRFWIAAVAIVSALMPDHPAPAQEPAPSAPKPKVEASPIELLVTPRPADVPAFRHRLIPLESERTPGDAAPIYLRIAGDIESAGLRELAEKPHEWLQLPPDKFPSVEARAFVDRWRGRLQQIDYGARRRSCDWNYTLSEEKDHVYEILLPDVQQMRTWARLVALKATVEIAEGKHDEAIRTLETGLSFSRDVAGGPFLINSLVGIALANLMLDRAEQLIGRPDAPNLYWPLTALPRPMIGVRESFENELKMVEWIFPELGEVDRPRTGAEWSALLDRFHGRMASVLKKSAYFDADLKKTIRFEADPSKFRATLLPEVRAYLKERERPAAGISDDQALMLYFVGRQREIRDDWSRAFYLPFAEAAPVHAEIGRRYASDKTGPFGLFIALAPIVEASRAAEARLDRRVAALRVVEAIRMQAASDGGKLPDSLAKVIVVPVPNDPATGKAFDLRRDGDSVVLSSPPLYEGRLIYRITLRK